MRICVFLTHWQNQKWLNVLVCPARKETGRMFYQNYVELSGGCLSGYQGAPAEFSQDWNKRLAGRWRNYATKGETLRTTTLQRGCWTITELHKEIFSRSPTTLLPHWVMETPGPMGGGAGVVRAVKLLPSLVPPSFSTPTLPPFPATHQPHPHSHRRSICPGRRLDTSLETGSRQPQPKYADCNNSREAVPIRFSFPYPF